ncbi:related to subtilisin-like serine protease [Melanopsichium pennsylvanicum]|uniref:Related to subtilisin-like serine protease n=2 Tax=Melanopsichium pennsylvanicum TaxID=63383 RepID=A0AAJ4XRN9_9BASI|nr:related to subtilisin-like serine protease [Melanopsichium pennsylvanicum 4]SNX87259.1 related to subtilisin-like serine protease [Melanopsichium pennsylvanicum]
MKFLSLAAATASAGLLLVASAVEAANVPSVAAGPRPLQDPAVAPNAYPILDNSRGKVAQLQKLNHLPRGYIIEFDSSSPESRVNPHAKVHDHLAKRAKGSYKTRFEFDDPLTFVGMSVVLDNDDDYDSLVSAPGVKKVYKTTLHTIPAFEPTTVSSDFVKAATGKDTKADAAPGRKKRRDEPKDAEQGYTDTFSPHVMTGVDKVHAKGFLGKGQVVCIVDTGVDYTHPGLGGKPGNKPCFGAGCLIEGGYAFVDDTFNGTNSPVASPEPFDCNGHGTHVAGTVAAMDTTLGFTGVAPHAKIRAYRIFGCTGPTSDDIIIAALQRAYFDGCDVISLSFGAPGGWSEIPSATVASKIASLGTPLAIAQCNSGFDGMAYASYPASGEHVMTVGSVQNTELTGFTADIVPKTLAKKNITYLTGSSFTFADGQSKTLEVYATSSSLTITDDACSPLPDSTPDLSNKVVLVGRGTCLFVTKLANVAAKGAKYVIIYNSQYSLNYIGTDIKGPQAASLTRDEGLYLKQQLNKGVKLALDFSTTALATIPDLATGGLMSAYSTYGPTYENHLNSPTISAPGGNILSTFPLAKGAYAILSGTSMATPFMSGSIAVFQSARGKMSAETLNSIFSNTAAPLNNATGDNTLLETVAKQGTGLVDINKALYQQITLSPSTIELNDTTHFNGTQTITVKNLGFKPLAYKLSHIPVGTAQSQEDDSIFFNLSPVPLSANYASVSFNKNTIVVPAKGFAEFTVTFTPPENVRTDKLPFYSGYIHLEPQSKGYSAANIAYGGYKADTSNTQILDNTNKVLGVGLPVLATADGKTYIEDDKTTYSLSNVAAWPQLFYRFNYGTPRVQIDIVDATLKFEPTYNVDGSFNTKKTMTGAAAIHKRFTMHKRQQGVAGNGQRETQASAGRKPGKGEGRTLGPELAGAGGSGPKPKPKPIDATPALEGSKFSDVPTIGILYNDSYYGRNPSTSQPDDRLYYVQLVTPELSLPQGGNTTLTPGTYKVLLRAQRVLTEGILESDYESYLSHSFTITK